MIRTFFIADKPLIKQLSKFEKSQTVQYYNCALLFCDIAKKLIGWLVGFNGISTSIGYLMPKPVYDTTLKPNNSFTRI